MTPFKPLGKRFFPLLLSFLLFSVIDVNAQDAANGKTLFMGKCASCHNVTKKGTGPALGGLEERHKWADHNEILKWAHNPQAYMANDPYTQGLKAEYGSLMQAFPDLTLKEVDDIVAYVNVTWNEFKNPKPDAAGTGAPAATGNSALIFGLISIVLGVVALILMQVNSNLKKMSDAEIGRAHV